ncbi:rhodanese-like domain-containing protein [Streptomyces sp. 3MP-14]|uniref:Rhodanese-like domain-containing protein n=1 Tax=Streptomyces mimosae TaxID=2586635 RepID=A0A5N6A719_9ACTN|nr:MULTISPECIES: rhodanese-like domain-containing protein [Streptomyces]KAB8163716.1 rhodanese-like domain-containing protein [Streptomyces mimosae]KAB8175159.1 rhodanese-like domain-containing protein [Streptomyces sp. 3MP-14]
MSFGVPAVGAGEVPDEGLLLDVREPAEWAAGHAEGAVHIPLGQVVERLPEIVELAGDGPVHVVCKAGGRSAQVTAFLQQQGVTAFNVDGGMHAWQAVGRPLVSDQGEPTVL